MFEVFARQGKLIGVLQVCVALLGLAPIRVEGQEAACAVGGQ